jgi:phage tail sheath protein FI
VWGADLSTIGIVGPAEGADSAAFPLNTPVLVRTNQSTLIAQLGVQGYLRDALEGIADQLGEMQRAARCVVVRTAAGADLNATIANIVGEATQRTGMHALLLAASTVGFVPRLLIIPGYTGQTQMDDHVGRIRRTVAGAGYNDGESYTLTVSGGTPTTPMTAHATGLPDGSMSEAVIDNPGAGYSDAPTITAPAPPNPPGVQATFTAHLAVVANPVCVELPGLCGHLFAHAIVESSGIAEDNDLDWRKSLQSERLIPISGGCRVLDPVTAVVVTRPLAPRVAGILVRRDHQMGAPFHSAANQPVYGIVGPAREIDFSLMDGDNEGQELLQRGLGILIRGDAGSDFAIAAGGFVFVGTDNASEDELWRMYNVTRGRDFIHIGLIRALRFYLGRFNITSQLVQALLNTMGFFLRDLQADEHILGWRLSFVGDRNSAEEIRRGHIVIGFRAEEPPVLRRITTESARFREAIAIMVSQLERQLGIAA